MQDYKPYIWDVYSGLTIIISAFLISGLQVVLAHVH